MKNEKLFDGITGIREEIIDRAENHRFTKQRSWRRWAALAAALVMAVCVGTFVLPRLGGNASQAPGEGGGSGHNQSTVFMSYAGPVFPLTLMERTDDVTAARDIAFDFALQMNEDYGGPRVWDIGVRDAYTLTNDGALDKAVTIAYPFTGSFKDLDDPALTLNGAPLETTLHAGPYSGGFRGAGDENSTSLNLDNITSWEGYKALLTGGAYMASAFADYPVLTEPVTVYEFTNITDGGSNAVNPTLNMAFHMNYENSIILTYGFNGGRYDPDTGDTARHFSIPMEGFRGYGEPRYLAVLGEDIDDYTIQGYQNGGCEPGTQIDGALATVTRYETTLGELIDVIARAFYDEVVGSDYDGDANRYISPNVSYDMYRGEVYRFFAEFGVAGENAKERYAFGSLEDIIGETVFHQRVLYLTAEITIPAGGSVSVTADMQKQPSFDFICSGSHNEGVLGYDMVTAVGSNLAFTAQTARVVNTDGIDIVRNNFGFDIATGATAVTLDMNVEHYYIEVRPKETAGPEE